jgi:hypothetical protein
MELEGSVPIIFKVLTVKNADGTLRKVTSYMLVPARVAGNDNCGIKGLAA